MMWAKYRGMNESRIESDLHRRKSGDNNDDPSGNTSRV